MTESLDIHKSDFIPLDEAAGKLGVHYNSITKWLRNNPDIKKDYCTKLYKDGRKRTFISLKGLLMVANLRETTKRDVMSLSRSGKKKLVESVAENQQTFTLVTQLANQAQMLLQQAQAIMENRSALTLVSEKTKEIEDRLTEIEGGQKSITTGQRKYLNERVRSLAFELDAPFPKVWKAVHDCTGRHSIDEYLFEDYGVAMEYLKRVYKKNNFNW